MERREAIMPPTGKGTGSASTRPSIREAFNATVEEHNIAIRETGEEHTITVREFVQRLKWVRIGVPAIREFSDNIRELTTRTLDDLLCLFSTQEFLFFLSVLESEEPQEGFNCADNDTVFLALLNHVAKNCDTEQFHEILCVLAENHPSRPQADHATRRWSNLTFLPARISIRDALVGTIDHFGLKATEISRSSTVPSSVISQFRAQNRDIRTNTLDQILQGLPTRQYLYFVGVLKGAISLLSATDGQCQGDSNEQFEAFCTLLAHQARQSTDERFENIFCLMTESRQANKR